MRENKSRKYLHRIKDRVGLEISEFLEDRWQIVHLRRDQDKPVWRKKWAVLMDTTPRGLEQTDIRRPMHIPLGDLEQAKRALRKMLEFLEGL